MYLGLLGPSIFFLVWYFTFQLEHYVVLGRQTGLLLKVLVSEHFLSRFEHE
jgi:hypothetical protein